MQNTMTVARRQFASYFNGPVAYIVMALVLLALGVFFWQDFFFFRRASVSRMFDLFPIFLLLAAPALTMGLLAEEKRNGTIELLLTMPIKDSEVIVGKFLGVLGVYAVMLVLTLAYPISVSTLGDLDWGQVWAGYFGLFLVGGSMLAIGIMSSSLTDNQLISFFVAAAICFTLYIVNRFLPFMPPALATPIEWISLSYHFESMGRGVIDSRDLIFFFSLIGVVLLIAFRALESRRWK
ncbi:MAG: ABC transporter permease subunit [Sandaracinaceae bacterium]|nr:ABC transporter permease subunit [Sandaracinaceae bacterium]